MPRNQFFSEYPDYADEAERTATRTDARRADWGPGVYSPVDYSRIEQADVTGEPWADNPEQAAKFAAYADYLPYADEDEPAAVGIAERLRQGRSARAAEALDRRSPGSGKSVQDRRPPVPRPDSRTRSARRTEDRPRLDRDRGREMPSAGWLDAHWPIVLVALAGLQRLWAAQARLPYLYDSTEPWNFLQGQRMVKEGAFRPEVYNSPSFVYEAGALWDWITRKLPGLPTIRADTQALGSIQVTGSLSFYLLRVLCVGLSLVALWCGVQLMRSIVASKVGQVIGALTLGFGYLQIENAHLFITASVGASFLLISAWALDRFESSARQVYLTSALVFAALAACTKYQLVLWLAAVLFGLISRRGWGFVRSPGFARAAAVSLGVALLAMPALVIAPGDVWHGLGLLKDSYTSARLGQEAPSALLNLGALIRSFGLLLPLALWGAWAAWSRGRCVVRAAAVFSGALLVSLSVLPSAFDTDLVSLLGPIALLVGLGADAVMERFGAASDHQGVGRVLSLALVAAAIPMAISSVMALREVGADPRAEAREFINTKLAEGSIIAVEDASPVVDRARFAIGQLGAVGSNTTPVSSDVDAVVLTSVASGPYRARLDEDPTARYLYERLMQSFCLEHRSESGSYWAEVYLRCEKGAS